MSTVRYSFHSKRTAAGAPKHLRAGEAQPVPAKVPRIVRLLALAHRFQGMLDRGDVVSMADLARLGRVSRARITQIMDLLMLAPEIQEELLCDGACVHLRSLFRVVRRVAWVEQRTAWRAVFRVKTAA